MDHREHIALIRNGIPGPGGSWADFGAGRGAFTLALADLLGPTGRIYSIDRDERALRDQRAILRERFPTVALQTIVADFGHPLALPPLDGALLTNSLHFLDSRHKDIALSLILGYLHPGGRLVVVEYATDRGNPWIPQPFSYATWETIARRNGFVGTRQIAFRPSRFNPGMYAALSFKPETPVPPSPQR